VKRFVPDREMLRSPLARRLIVAIIVTSSTITLCLTAFQLYGEFRSELGGIQDDFQQIEEVHLNSLSQSLWATNEAELQLQIEGIRHVPNLEYVVVREGARIWAQAGHRVSRKTIERQYPMTYVHRGQTLEIGMLTVVASLDAVYGGLVNRAFIILASNAFKTFLVAGFAFVFFHWLVNRHLVSIAGYLRGLDLRGRASPLILARAAGRRPDELDEVAASINLMHGNARSLLTELQHETELARLLEQLARAANEAVSPEAAMEICLRRICEDGKWALGRVATFPPGLPQRKPDRSQWFCVEPARFDAFMRYSDGYEFMGGRSVFINVVLRDQCPLWLPDLTALDTARLARLAMATEAGLKAAFAFPVIVSGEIAAFLEFFATEARPPDALFIDGTSSLASQFARLIERRRSERINAQLAAIVESSNDAIVSRDLDRAILTWNAAAERLFGYTAAEVIGRDVSLIIPADQEARGAQLQVLLEDGFSVPTYDAVRLGKGGRRIDVSIVASPIKDSSGKMIGVSIVFRDISERKRAQVERAQLAAIVESSNDAILTRGPDRTILSWNAAAERLFGWSAQEAVGQPIDLIVPPERPGLLQRFIERLERGEPISPVETTHLRKGGSRFPTQITFSPIRDGRGTVVAHALTVRDMTELKRSEEALRSYAARMRDLSRRLREQEESERRAISRELHDRIGPGLTTLGLMVGALDARLPSDSRNLVGTLLKDMQALIQYVVTQVRDIMAELRPPVLDDYGLLAALRQLVTEFANRNGIAVNLSGVDPYPRLPRIVETAMFRISQEAFNNIAKHAHAKIVEISLNPASDRVVLDIADDGVGFDTSDMQHGGEHWGMITMRERAEAVGITLRLESAPGAGTRLVLEAERAAI